MPKRRVTEEVLDIIKTLKIFTPRGVATELKANRNTVRAIFTRLRKEGIVIREEGGIWRPSIPTFFRKYVSELAYCSGKKTQLYALTYEDNKINRESYLEDIILAFYDQKCGNFMETGYSQMEYFDKITQSKIYPLYEVGTL